MKEIAILLLLINSASAKSVNESMIVTHMNWSKDKKMYRLTMLKHAAVYWAPKNLESCLVDSIKRGVEYSMTFDTKNLQISKCKLIKMK